jgi:hypothetical protein
MDDRQELLDLLRNLLGLNRPQDGRPRWQLWTDRDAPFFREAPFRARAASAGVDADAAVASLRDTFSVLLSRGLLAASHRARACLQQGLWSWSTDDDRTYEVVMQVHARSAIRVNILSAVLYVDGVETALIEVGSSVRRVTDRLEGLEEALPAWFVTPALLVAVGFDGVAVSTPCTRGQRWRQMDGHAAAELLAPDALMEFARHDVFDQPESGGLTRRFVPPATSNAVRLARQRVGQGADGLLSVPEGAEHRLAIRALVSRLLEDGISPLVLVSTREQGDRMGALLHDFPSGDTELLDRGVTLALPVQLARRFDQQGPLPLRPRAVLAFGVDAGFRGEQGFAIRLLMPSAPWISFTTLPPEAVAPEVKHAFANPVDDQGFLDVVDEVTGRVPILHVATKTWDPEHPSHLDRAAHDVANALDRPDWLRVLVLVPDPSDAFHLAALLHERVEAQVLNATEWGSANQGWELLRRDSDRPAVVVRTSLPFWAAVPDLDAAFVFRGTGRTTLARMRNLLGRPREGKQFAQLAVMGLQLEQGLLGWLDDR